MIDCPAMRQRLKGYPYGNRVPSKIRMLKTVKTDFPLRLDPKMVKVAVEGSTWDAWTNSYGAVSAVMPEGKLGLKPSEFEVVEWHDPGR